MFLFIITININVSYNRTVIILYGIKLCLPNVYDTSQNDCFVFEDDDPKTIRNHNNNKNDIRMKIYLYIIHTTYS